MMFPVYHDFDVLLLCCVQVQGAPACAAGGGEEHAQTELAVWTQCTGGAAAAVSGGPEKH